MKKTIFVDTNILLSGIFFRGNEAKLLSTLNVELITSDTVIQEIGKVAQIKFKPLKVESRRIALQEIDNSLRDISKIIKKSVYSRKIREAQRLVAGKEDAKILAAVLATEPDYFITGDKHFHTKKVKERVRVRHTRDILRELKL